MDFEVTQEDAKKAVEAVDAVDHNILKDCLLGQCFHRYFPSDEINVGTGSVHISDKIYFLPPIARRAIDAFLQEGYLTSDEYLRTFTPFSFTLDMEE